jgi:hypothetical protein
MLSSDVYNAYKGYASYINNIQKTEENCKENKIVEVQKQLDEPNKIETTSTTISSIQKIDDISILLDEIEKHYKSLEHNKLKKDLIVYSNSLKNTNIFYNVSGWKKYFPLLFPSKLIKIEKEEDIQKDVTILITLFSEEIDDGVIYKVYPEFKKAIVKSLNYPERYFIIEYQNNNPQGWFGIRMVIVFNER